MNACLFQDRAQREIDGIGLQRAALMHLCSLCKQLPTFHFKGEAFR